MPNLKLPSVATLALLLAVEPGAAQTIEQRFERWFGPPAGQTGQGARPSRPAEPARSRPSAPAAASVPTPSERPADAALSDPTAPNDVEPGEPAAETEAPDASPEPGDARQAGADTDEADPAHALEPEIVPTPESRPEAEPTSEPAPPADAPVPEDETPGTDEPADPAEVAKPASEPAPEPAYVPPESARTSPEESAPQTPDFEVTPQESVDAARAIEDARECEAELEARGAEFAVGPSLSEGQCGVLRPVALTRTSSGMAVSPDTAMLCRTALAFDIWVAEGVAPAARTELGAGAPAAIRHASTYVCRDRASETGLSEHGRGSAIDIGAFEWEDREPIAVESQAPGSPEDRFLASVRRAACGPFQTVIGPGTDADHADHFHLDIAARSNGSTYCR